MPLGGRADALPLPGLRFRPLPPGPRPRAGGADGRAGRGERRGRRRGLGRPRGGVPQVAQPCRGEGSRDDAAATDPGTRRGNPASRCAGTRRKACILDVFHAPECASEALKVLVRCVFARKARLAGIKAQLLDGKVGRVMADLRPHRSRGKAVAKCIDQFDSNKGRMRHDECRARGMQIGSGQIESGCKKMVAARFKRSGCEWSRRGANALPALKACWKNLQREEFAPWKAQRIAAAQPENWRAPRN